MLPIEFQKERSRINGKLGPRLHQIQRLAGSGNSLAQRLIHVYERWMDSKDEGDLVQLEQILTQFEQVKP